KCKILHRDLSVGNIVIYRGKGFLIDWDLAKLLIIQDDPYGMFISHSHSYCTDFADSWGTWQFMSAHLVKNINAVHGVEDDLESSLYVVLWMAL
ncbi:hypothetical protein BD769DRAFT_1307493, partial [Suillus cothurnatus]